MKQKVDLLIISLIFALSLVTACKKEEVSANCYDKNLAEKNKNNVCPMDCPGITGCDDKTYCNECIAARNGIKIKN